MHNGKIVIHRKKRKSCCLQRIWISLEDNMLRTWISLEDIMLRTWISLEDVMLREIIQAQENKYHITSCTCEILLS